MLFDFYFVTISNCVLREVRRVILGILGGRGDRYNVGVLHVMRGLISMLYNFTHVFSRYCS